MFRGSFERIAKYESLYARPTHSAELDVIMPLLTYKFFRKPQVQILLTNYTLEEPPDKPDTICQIMRLLWPERVRGALFNQFKEFENFLIAVGKRDHFLHQFLVFLVGLNVIQVLLQKYRDKADRERVFKFRDERYIFYTWLMTATAHDFGYPIEVGSDIFSKLSTLYKIFGMRNFSKSVGLIKPQLEIAEEHDFDKIEIRRLSSMSPVKTMEELDINHVLRDQLCSDLRIEMDRADKLLHRLKKGRDHGYVGAIILCSTVLKSHLARCKGNWDQVESSKLYRALQAAIAAIAVHNFKYKRDRKRISLESNFYAYLLYLIDNIQDWSRGCAGVGEWPKYWLRSFVRDDKNCRIEINYKLYHTSWTKLMERRINKGLREKKEAIASLQAPSHPLGMTVAVKYKSSHSKINETLEHTF